MLRSIFSGIKSLLHPAQRNAEIEADVESFRESAVEYKMRLGMSREDAERAARAEIRSAEMIRHKVWSAGWESLAESLWRDAVYGLRQVGRSPGLSIVAILSLALGIGANTAIFTVIDDLMLKQLPVHDPKMLVSFGDGNDGGIIASSSPGAYDIFPYDFYRYIAGAQKEGSKGKAIKTNLTVSAPLPVSPQRSVCAPGPAAAASLLRHRAILFLGRSSACSARSHCWAASSTQMTQPSKAAMQ